MPILVLTTYIPILIILVVLGIIILSKNNLNRVNVIFSFFVFSIAIWVLALIFADSLKSYDQALLWNKLALVGPSFIPYTFLIFVAFYTKGYKLSKLKLFLLFIPVLIILVLVPTKYNVEEIIIHDWGAEVVPGHLYIFFLVFLVLYMGKGFYLLGKKYKKASGIVKMQIRYIFAGIFLGTILGVFTNLVLLLVGISNLSILGPFAGLIISICISYAIFRYRLMDIRIVIHKSIVYSLLLFVTLIFYSGLIFILTRLIGLASGIAPIVSGGVATLVLVFSFKSLERIFQKITNRFFFKAPYDYGKTLIELGELVNTIVDLEELLNIIIVKLKKILQIQEVKFFLHDKNNNNYILLNNNSTPNKKIILSTENALVKNLDRTKKPLMLEELEYEIDNTGDNQQTKNKCQDLKEELQKLNGALMLPLLFQNELIGIIQLGTKLSRDPYTSQDLNLLGIFSQQVAIAINNANIYKNMEIIIDQRTKNLRTALTKLEEISRAKTEFVSIASHQLRSPLSIVKGILSMTISSDFGKLNEMQNNYLTKAYNNANRLNELINTLLNVTRIETGRVELELKLVSIEDMIKNIVANLQLNAQQKNLKLLFQKNKTPLPKVLLDQNQIKEVLVNLIDNAINYTQKGKITVSAKQKANEIIIDVKDTGMGFSNKESIKMFQKFSRSERGKKDYSNGTGLGLYVARKIIGAHNGKIWAESPGPGKGSTFSFSLPLEK